MKAEHTLAPGHDFKFTTPNYKINTSTALEWRYVVDGEEVPPDQMLHGRQIPNVKDLHDRFCLKLVFDEIVSIVLYTGPMVSYFSRGISMLSKNNFLTLMIMNPVFYLQRCSSSIPSGYRHKICRSRKYIPDHDSRSCLCNKQARALCQAL